MRLCKMNLAVHGLSGDIRQANTYYEDIHNSVGKFDFVMANPPFNVDKVDKEKIKDDPRFPVRDAQGRQRQLSLDSDFLQRLERQRPGGFRDGEFRRGRRGTEMEIRRKLIESGAVDVMISIGPNFFYTVTLPCTLWFFDRGKAGHCRGGARPTLDDGRCDHEGRANPPPTTLDDGRDGHGGGASPPRTSGPAARGGM